MTRRDGRSPLDTISADNEQLPSYAIRTRPSLLWLAFSGAAAISRSLARYASLGELNDFSQFSVARTSAALALSLRTGFSTDTWAWRPSPQTRRRNAPPSTPDQSPYLMAFSRSSPVTMANAWQPSMSLKTAVKQF